MSTRWIRPSSARLAVGHPSLIAIGASLLLAGCSREPAPAPGPTPPPSDATAAEARGSATEIPPAPPRETIEGWSGFSTRSELALTRFPDQPYFLETTTLFPDRVRWHMGTATRPPRDKRLHYRYGESVFAIRPEDTAGSAAIVGDEREGFLLQMELRRALFLYPHGFEWLDGRAELAGLGHLEVELPSGSEEVARGPERLASFDRDGRPFESIRRIVWRDESMGLIGPESFEFWIGDDHVWTEQVTQVDLDPAFVDAFFVPPDRRGLRPLAKGPRWQRRLVPTTAYLELPLARGSRTWKGAVEAWTNEAPAQRARFTGLSYASRPWVDLDDDGTPRALWLPLEDLPAGDLPRAFRSLPEHQALALFLGATSAVSTALTEGPGEAVPEGQRLGSPYGVLEPTPPDGGRVHLVIPLEPR